MQGKQPYDSGRNVSTVPHLFGGYWKHRDWNQAIADGMVAAGLSYSGVYGWAGTDMCWKVNHMVVPKSRALECNDCHGTTGRVAWKAWATRAIPRKRGGSRQAQEIVTRDNR